MKLLSLLNQNKNMKIGSSIIIFFIIIAIFMPIFIKYSPDEIFSDYLRIPPFWMEGGSFKFILGTDDIGRDILSRLIYGTRISLGIGILITSFGLVIGTTLGMLSGYYGGKVDWIIMRFIDTLMSLPSILLAIVVVSVMGPGIKNAIIAMGIVSIPSFTRITRASAIAERKKQYVDASSISGTSNFKIMFREILPNCMAPIIIQTTLGFSEGILGTAALGFLGLGAQPPLPEWGTMLSDARLFIESTPWLVILPGMCIFLSVLGFNLFGDGLRDFLDPKLKELKHENKTT